MRIIANKVVSKKILEDIFNRYGSFNLRKHINLITFKKLKKYNDKTHFEFKTKKYCIYIDKKTLDIDFHIFPYSFLSSIDLHGFFYRGFNKPEYNYYGKLYRFTANIMCSLLMKLDYLTYMRCDMAREEFSKKKQNKFKIKVDELLTSIYKFKDNIYGINTEDMYGNEYKHFGCMLNYISNVVRGSKKYRMALIKNKARRNFSYTIARFFRTKYTGFRGQFTLNELAEILFMGTGLPCSKYMFKKIADNIYEPVVLERKFNKHRKHFTFYSLEHYDELEKIFSKQINKIKKDMHVINDIADVQTYKGKSVIEW